MALHLLRDETPGTLNEVQKSLVEGAITDCDRLLAAVEELQPASPTTGQKE